MELIALCCSRRSIFVPSFHPQVCLWPTWLQGLTGSASRHPCSSDQAKTQPMTSKAVCGCVCVRTHPPPTHSLASSCFSTDHGLDLLSHSLASPRPRTPWQNSASLGFDCMCMLRCQGKTNFLDLSVPIPVDKHCLSPSWTQGTLNCHVNHLPISALIFPAYPQQHSTLAFIVLVRNYTC